MDVFIGVCSSNALTAFTRFDASPPNFISFADLTNESRFIVLVNRTTIESAH